MVNYFRYVPVCEGQSRYLASWRGASAIVVLVGHGFDIFVLRPHPIWSVVATSAVLIFFGLSGFFIHKALAKSIARRQPLLFVAGRVNRIVPPFAISLILVVLLWAFAPAVFLTGERSFIIPTARTEFSLDGLLSSAFFLNGFAGPTLSANGPLWSLSYEFWYYVAAYLVGVAVLYGRKWPVAVAVGLLLALTAANPRFAIFGVVWGCGFALSALHGLNRVPKIPEAPILAVAIVSILLAAFEVFRGAQIIANLTVGFWFVVHMAQVLCGKVPWIIGALERSSHFAYALYVLHFPLLLFIYGATGEQAWVAGPATLLVFVAIALFGRKLEEIKLIGFPGRSADHQATLR